MLSLLADMLATGLLALDDVPMLREDVARGEPTTGPGWAPAAALVLAGLCLAAWGAGDLVRRDRQRRGPTHRLLCKQLGIPASQWRAVRALAREAGMEEPAALLVSRGALETACRRAPDAANRPEIHALRGRHIASESRHAA